VRCISDRGGGLVRSFIDNHRLPISPSKSDPDCIAGRQSQTTANVTIKSTTSTITAYGEMDPSIVDHGIERFAAR
jgi:hypothetical protein